MPFGLNLILLCLRLGWRTYNGVFWRFWSLLLLLLRLSKNLLAFLNHFVWLQYPADQLCIDFYILKYAIDEMRLLSDFRTFLIKGNDLVNSFPLQNLQLAKAFIDLLLVFSDICNNSGPWIITSIVLAFHCCSFYLFLYSRILYAKYVN